MGDKLAMADVTIRGAGIFGLSLAWVCLQRGARVRVIDPNGPGAGASGGLVGALAPHVPENWNSKKGFQLESLLMAQPFWSEVETEGGVSSGYTRAGRLQPIIDAHALTLAQRRADTAKTLWGPAATWQVIDTPPVPAWAPHSATGFWILDTLSAHLHPKRACQSLVAALSARGAEITREGRDAGTVVWATGVADLDRISQSVGRTVGNGVKGQAALLQFAMPDGQQLFADGLHFVPHVDGTLAIGSTSEREYDTEDQTDDQLDALIDRARELLPALRDAPILSRWAGIRPRSKSRAPMLGPHPLDPTQFIANGGFKIGFGMAPKCANVMADLVLEGRDAIPEAFRPEASLGG